MKYLISMSVFLLSLVTSAQESKTKLLEVVLTDSVINKYMVNLGGVDIDMYKLFHESGYYLVNNGIVEFEEHNCNNNNSMYKQYGIIKKIKIKNTKASVKIHFTPNNNTRVRLRKEAKKWRVQSRLIYRNWRFPRNQQRLVYYSFDS